MVKSLIAILTAIALLVGAAVFESYYVSNQFGDFEQELLALYAKVDGETANGEDAKAVQTSWEHRKEHLHVWIPHNDVARIDDYMSETVRLIGEKEYPYALANLEILIHLCSCLPGTYSPALENIF
ncbi:MAG: DUF4363 family protein [Clostridia bacterium]|nr:DUF4363 family protein [Clostridia bacterium]